MIKNQLFIAAALLAGVAIGYFLKPERAAEPAVSAEPCVAVKIDDQGASASVKALRARIAELERLLAAQANERPLDQVAEAQPVEASRGERPGPPTMKEMRERMEKMEKDDPQGFAQMTNRFARWRRRRVERANAKLDFLSSVDTSGMTAEQKQSHERYQELIARREDLEEKMHGADMTDETREALFREMRETDHALWQAARAERETLIGQTAQALGLTGDDAAAVSATIRDVISSTDQHHAFGPPHGGPGPDPR